MTFQMNTPINRTNAVSYPWPHDIPAYNQVAIVGGGVPLFSNQDFRMFFILGFILNGLHCFCNQETIEMAHNEGLPIYFENLPIRLDFKEAAMARDTEILYLLPICIILPPSMALVFARLQKVKLVRLNRF